MWQGFVRFVRFFLSFVRSFVCCVWWRATRRQFFKPPRAQKQVIHAKSSVEEKGGQYLRFGINLNSNRTPKTLLALVLPRHHDEGAWDGTVLGSYRVQLARSCCCRTGPPVAFMVSWPGFTMLSVLVFQFQFHSVTLILITSATFRCSQFCKVFDRIRVPSRCAHVCTNTSRSAHIKREADFGLLVFVYLIFCSLYFRQTHFFDQFKEIRFKASAVRCGYESTERK